MNNSPPPEVVTLLNTLSPQEMRVLCACHPGLSISAIADTLNLSEHTIGTHRKHILKKWLAATGQTKGSAIVFWQMLQQVMPFLPPLATA
jgi:DNA-binding NarL/FixJ family response regulator